MGKQSRRKKERKVAQRRLSIELKAVYDHIPDIKCKGLCHETCTIIGVMGAELANMKKAAPGIFDPYVMPRAQDNTYLIVPGPGEKCPALINNRCSIYEARPLICRTWGVTPTLPCVFGCKPSKWLEDDEARILMQDLADLSN